MQKTKREQRIKKKFGLRNDGKPIGIPLDHPQELGYRCPKGHANLTWSEFNEHIWCYDCKLDYHYADECLMIANEFMPNCLPKFPRIIKGIRNWSRDGNHLIDIPARSLKKFYNAK